MTVAALAEVAISYLRNIETLEQNQRNAADLEATYKEIQAAKEVARDVYRLYQLYHNRLPIRDIQQTDLPKILNDIQQLQVRFVEEQQRRQVQDLRNITSQLNKIRTILMIEWHKYTEVRLRPYLDLHDTVRTLPEIRSQEALLNRLNNELQHAKSVMPQTQYEITAFDHSFELYKQQLASLEHLHVEVRAFLQKANAHTATMADVTDEVLRWCRQGEHAKVLRVSFTY